ncbi:MAG: ATP-binding protein [Myxococcales bacterium]|nr:ATP-binding protein [Myxococcales bacterium]
MRKFNVAGPCRSERHYMIPPERRLPGLVALVDEQAYFVVHAPRQTGKTTIVQALARRLTAEGRYAALHFSCEMGRPFDDDVEQATQAVWGAIEDAAARDLPEALRPPPTVDAAVGVFLHRQLSRWAGTCPRPLVLVFDEIDALAGSSLYSVLSQLRAGFSHRPATFPWSVILCGMRDVRDYKAASGGGPVRMGSSSPFNIKEQSIRLSSFTEAEVRELYAQHTADTGQAFTEEALACAWSLTQGQPWLTNALAREVVERGGVAPPGAIEPDHVLEAKERLILSRATHLDSLLARLREDAVRRVLEPVLAGGLPGGATFDGDFEYVVDLGLVTPGLPVRIANPIYREIIVRVLATQAEAAVPAEPRRHVTPDGRLDLRALLEGFARFWREHGEVVAGRIDYPEVAPQLVLMAYLHRIVNGGGTVEREVGVGRMRIDLVVHWPYVSAEGQRETQRSAMELKVWRDRDKRGDPLAQGLVQLDEYLARLGLDEGVLVIFDCRSKAEAIEERTRFESARTPGGRAVTVLRA